MKRKRHSPEQIVAKLREADALLVGGATIAQIYRRLEVAAAEWTSRAACSNDEILRCAQDDTSAWCLVTVVTISY
jgi:hypothetical protein